MMSDEEMIKKKGPGRPVKSEEDKKNQWLHIRLSKQEREMIDAISVDTKLSRADVIRKLVQVHYNDWHSTQNE